MGFNVRDKTYTSTGDVTGYISGSSAIDLASAGSVWAGTAGSAAYTVGDIVSALKEIGVLAQ